MMTSPRLARSAATNPSRRPRHAFTLIEVLVVIGIIAVLAGILVPVISRARKQAAVARTRADLHAIAIALDAYKADFGDYPRVEFTQGVNNFPDRPEPPTGAEILCWALIGPAKAAEPLALGGSTQHLLQDGNDGPGFRARGVQGRVYGPYLPADKFRLGIQGGTVPNSALLYCILDSNSNPILYLPASPKHLNPTDQLPLPPAYIGQTSNASLAAMSQTTVWDFTDVDSPIAANNANEHYFRRPTDSGSTDALKRFQILLGDYNPSNPAAATNCNGRIDPGETAATTGPFILWSAGADGEFGTNSVTPSAKELSACDDVTNFNQ